MRKEVNKPREEKVWCYGLDLRKLQEISFPDEEWEFLGRIIKEPLGDCYLVSNMGRMYNTGKQELCPLYPDDTRQRHVKVSLEQVPVGLKNYSLHRLVAGAFVSNSDPEEKTIVHHIDGDPSNNKAVNLVWLTPSEHRIAHALKNSEMALYCDWIAAMRKIQPIKRMGALLPLSGEEFDEIVASDRKKGLAG